MSHFTVMVIGDDPEEKLAPYQENNMGDCPEEYLEFISLDKEYREEWDKNERTVSNYYPRSLVSSDEDKYVPLFSEEQIESFARDNILLIDKMDGYINPYSLHVGNKYYVDIPREMAVKYCLSLYCVDFDADSREKPKDIDTVKFHFEFIDGSWDKDEKAFLNLKFKPTIPPVSNKIQDLYPDFDTFVRDFHGQDKNPDTGEYGYFDNPNAKWDWYLLGGRWRGFFKLKKEAIEKYAEDNKDIVVGEPGVGGNEPVADCDQAYKGEIDWDMHNTPEKIKEAKDFWKFYVMDANPENEEEVKIKDSLLKDAFFRYKPEYYLKEYGSEETYVKSCIDIVTYAVITEDGEWHEAGEMGWWGVSHAEEGETAKFHTSFYECFIKDLPDDTLISVFDCHI